MIPIVKEKTKVKLELSIPIGAPITLVKDQIDTPPFVVLKTVKILLI